MFNRRAIEIASLYYPDEYPEPESIVLFRLHHLMINEMAVEMNERQGGRSSIKRLDTFYYMAKVSLAIFCTFIRVNKKQSDGKHSPDTNPNR
jgi:hypothetical protein